MYRFAIMQVYVYKVVYRKKNFFFLTMKFSSKVYPVFLGLPNTWKYKHQ